MMGGSKSTVEELPATGDERHERAERDEDEQRDDSAALAAIVVKRRRLELARTDVMRQLERARAEAHRVMLNRALQALEEELDRLV